MKYPNEVQQELLYSLINTASKTEVGLMSDFSSIKNYEDFKNRLPIVNYEDIYEQMCKEASDFVRATHRPWGEDPMFAEYSCLVNDMCIDKWNELYAECEKA